MTAPQWKSGEKVGFSDADHPDWLLLVMLDPPRLEGDEPRCLVYCGVDWPAVEGTVD